VFSCVGPGRLATGSELLGVLISSIVSKTEENSAILPVTKRSFFDLQPKSQN
jgi:hypothetical protein